jgi:hypothetical protein
MTFLRTTRGRTGLAAILVLLLLDLGRSMLVRQATVEPVSRWKTRPEGLCGYAVAAGDRNGDAGAEALLRALRALPRT